MRQRREKRGKDGQIGSCECVFTNVFICAVICGLRVNLYKGRKKLCILLLWVGDEGAFWYITAAYRGAHKFLADCRGGGRGRHHFP